MAQDARRKNENWHQPNMPTWDSAQVAVLMDLRDELQEANRCLRALVSVLQCKNFQAIPKVLRRISANTAKPKKRKLTPARSGTH